MLVDYLRTQRPYQPVRIQTRSVRRKVYVPIVFGCCALIFIIIVVPLALIPIYIKHGGTNQMTISDNETISMDEKLIFKIPDIVNYTSSFLLQDGNLNSTGLKELENLMQSTMAASSNEVISTARITVKHASIMNSTDNARKTRQTQTQTLYIILDEITYQHIPNRIKILNVTCTVAYKKKYNYYSQTDLAYMLRIGVEKLRIPYYILMMMEKKCSDEKNYFEPVTGHTCQTYIDYGFCNGTQVLMGSAINEQLAKENCCSCGKKQS